MNSHAARLIIAAATVMLVVGCAHSRRATDHRSAWEHHKKSALLYIYSRHPRSGEARSFGPVYRRRESLVVEDGELITLRYHLAFYWTDEELSQLRETFRPTHLVEYDIATGRWTALRIVQPPGATSR